MILDTLPPVLSVADVMERYGLRDRRAARGLMDKAGAIMAAGRLVVRVDDLDAWETAQKEARKPPEPPARVPRVRSRPARREPRKEVLPPKFWQVATPQA